MEKKVAKKWSTENVYLMQKKVEKEQRNET